MYEQPSGKDPACCIATTMARDSRPNDTLTITHRGSVQAAD
jgi:hypothetical protein